MTYIEIKSNQNNPNINPNTDSHLLHEGTALGTRCRVTGLGAGVTPTLTLTLTLTLALTLTPNPSCRVTGLGVGVHSPSRSSILPVVYVDV